MGNPSEPEAVGQSRLQLFIAHARLATEKLPEPLSSARASRDSRSWLCWFEDVSAREFALRSSTHAAATPGLAHGCLAFGRASPDGRDCSRSRDEAPRGVVPRWPGPVDTAALPPGLCPVRSRGWPVR